MVDIISNAMLTNTKKIARGDFAHYSCVRPFIRPSQSRPFLPLPLFSRPLSCHKLLLPNREQAVPPFNIIASKPKEEGYDIIALATLHATAP